MIVAFNKWFVGVILAGVFFYSLMSFAINLGNDNNAEMSILDNPTLNNSFNRIENNLSLYTTQTETQKGIFEDEDVQVSFGDLIFFGIISTGKTISNMIVGVVGILLVPFLILLSFPPIVLGSISTIVLGLIIFKAWRLYKTGE